MTGPVYDGFRFTVYDVPVNDVLTVCYRRLPFMMVPFMMVSGLQFMMFPLMMFGMSVTYGFSL